MYSRNYHNDAKCAIKINYVFVSDEKFLYYITQNSFQVRFVIAVLMVKCDVMCSGSKCDVMCSGSK